MFISLHAKGTGLTHLAEETSGQKTLLAEKIVAKAFPGDPRKKAVTTHNSKKPLAHISEAI
jgi:hypothetical protein